MELSTVNQTVPFYFEDETLIFYGQAPTSRYIANRPYILAVGDNGILMSETAVSPPTADTIVKSGEASEKQEQSNAA